MTDLQKMIEKAKELKNELMELERSAMMKAGQLEDLVKEILKKHLGHTDDKFNIPDLIDKAYSAGQLQK